MELNYNFKNFDDLYKVLEKAIIKSNEYNSKYEDVDLKISKSKIGFWNLKIEIKDGGNEVIDIIDGSESN